MANYMAWPALIEIDDLNSIPFLILLKDFVTDNQRWSSLWNSRAITKKTHIIIFPNDTLE